MQQMKALVTKPGNLGLIPNPTRWKERMNSHKLSFGFHMHDMYSLAHINKWMNKKQDELWSWPPAPTCVCICTWTPTCTHQEHMPPQPSHRICMILTHAILKLVFLWLEPRVLVFKGSESISSVIWYLLVQSPKLHIMCSTADLCYMFLCCSGLGLFHPMCWNSGHSMYSSSLTQSVFDLGSVGWLRTSSGPDLSISILGSLLLREFSLGL